MINQLSIEILLLTFTSLTTGFVVFASGAFQRILESVDEPTFKKLLAELTNSALKSPFIIGLSLATMIGMIPYWIFFGLSNLWFSAGLILWILTSVVAKVTRLPIYEKVKALKNSNVKDLNEQRRKLHFTSILSSALSLMIVLLMLIGIILHTVATP